MPIPALDWLPRVVATFWLLTISYVDARTATIPNWLTLSAISFLSAWRLLRAGWHLVGLLWMRWGPAPAEWVGEAASDARSFSALLFLVGAWAFCFLLWELHILGGGDAKTLMGILALFPSTDFVFFLAVAMLVLSVPLLLLRMRGKRLRDIPAKLANRLRSGSLLPTQHELEAEGRPYAWTFCVPGVVYLWLLW
jgi:Flp pilus assembly protein protease CpaA